MAAAIFALMQREGRNSGAHSSVLRNEASSKPLLTFESAHVTGPGQYQEAFRSAALPSHFSMSPQPIDSPPKAGLTPLVSHQHGAASVKCVTIPLSAPVQVPPKQCSILQTRGPSRGQGGQPRTPDSREAREQGHRIYAIK